MDSTETHDDFVKRILEQTERAWSTPRGRIAAVVQAHEFWKEIKENLECYHPEVMPGDKALTDMMRVFGVWLFNFATIAMRDGILRGADVP